MKTREDPIDGSAKRVIFARKQKKSEETSKASQKNNHSGSNKRRIINKKKIQSKTQTESSLSPETIRELRVSGKKEEIASRFPKTLNLESHEYGISVRNSKIFSRLRQRKFREISSSENSSSTSKQLSLNSLSRGPRGGLNEEEEKKLTVDRFKKSQTLKRQLEEKIKHEVSCK